MFNSIAGDSSSASTSMISPDESPAVDSSVSDELPTSDSSVQGWRLTLTSKAHFQFQLLLLLVLLIVLRSLLLKVNVYV